MKTLKLCLKFGQFLGYGTLQSVDLVHDPQHDRVHTCVELLPDFGVLVADGGGYVLEVERITPMYPTAGSATVELTSGKPPTSS